MPAGRPPLSPETKLQHRQQSLKNYQAKNVERLREAARSRMQRRRAAVAASDLKTRKTYRFQAALHSSDYRYRKRKEEYAAAEVAQHATRKLRKVEANELRARHVAPQRAAPTHAAPTSIAPMPLAVPGRSGVPSLDPHDLPMEELPSFLSDDEEDSPQPHSDARPYFEDGFSARPRPVVQRCRECGDEYCVGCACMCPVSTQWFEHKDGHFFPTCKWCKGQDCPGCACTCPESQIWVEHGGHARKKKRLFNSS
ncbi:hypothetical protein MSAN_01764500 [Mycena sanguinolenta]|uniref:Uncharacterized protein n=1 Tax=Mycena sanguinolenta TaxID=230812 RepID=A0A8H6XWP8_9AGAR|nr:hypothetical protein MSAN_01764500 [Mycena sanguinolenta]